MDVEKRVEPSFDNFSPDDPRRYTLRYKGPQYPQGLKQLREDLARKEEEHSSQDRRELDIRRVIRLNRQGKFYGF